MSGFTTSERPSSRRSLPWLVRWLHTYVSMFGFAAVVFFALTGLTLNHADWFEAGGQTTSEAKGTLELAWLAPRNEPGQQVAELRIAEHLRAAHGLRGSVTEFRVDDVECVVVWKGPGYAADAFIDRSTGAYELTATHKGLFAVIDDLHKGRDSGPVWSLVVDASAIVVAIAGLTGLWLLWYVKRRRWSGLCVLLAGTVLPVVVGVVFVA